jgi:hypothetical protein
MNEEESEKSEEGSENGAEGSGQDSQRNLIQNGRVSSNGGSRRGQDGILIYPQDLLVQSSPSLSSEQSLNDSPVLTFVTLPHPRYGHNIEFIQVNSHHLYEFQTIQPRKYGSWFIDQRVCSNSSLYLLSKYDIRFLFLPYLILTSAKYSPLSQILSSTNDEQQTNEMRKIELKYQNEWKLDEICDVNDKLGDDMILYRLNYEKLSDCLRGKVTKMTQVIYQKRKQRESKESTALFDSSFQSKKQSESRDDIENTPTDEDLKTAVTILLDYLPDSVALRLLQSYDMTMESLSSSSQNSNKRKADWEAALEVCLQFVHLLSSFFDRSRKRLYLLLQLE